MFEQACRRIESTITPFLQDKLDQVRKYKESSMADTQNVSTWKCAICGASGMKAPRYVRSHMSSKHKDLAKEDHPDPIEVPYLSAVPDAVSSQDKGQPEVVVLPDKELQAPAMSMEDIIAKRVGIQDSAPPVAGGGMPPVVTPQVVTPPEATSQLFEVPVGSVIELHGPQWKMNPITNQWVGFAAQGVQVDVFAKAPGLDSVMMLSCRTVGGTDLWSVPEPIVLLGKLATQTRVIQCPSQGTPTSFQVGNDDGVVEPIQDPAYLAEQQAIAEEFKKRAAVYVAARDEFAAKEKAFNAVRESHREFLMDFIKSRGVKDDHSLSILLEDLGYYSQVVISQGEPRVIYDETAIVEFLMVNGLDSYLSSPGFDSEKWELLKTLKAENGDPVVDAEFINRVERVESPVPRESLCINVLK